MTAYQHQPLLGAFANHRMHLLSGLGIKESRRFIENFDWLFSEPGPQQPQPMNLSAGEGILRQGERFIQPALALKQVGQPQPLQPGLDVVLVPIRS